MFFFGEHYDIKECSCLLSMAKNVDNQQKVEKQEKSEKVENKGLNSNQKFTDRCKSIWDDDC